MQVLVPAVVNEWLAAFSCRHGRFERIPNLWTWLVSDITWVQFDDACDDSTHPDLMDAEQDPSLAPPVSGGCNFHKYINPQKSRKPDRILFQKSSSLFTLLTYHSTFLRQKLTRSFSPHGADYNLHAIFTSGTGVVGNGQHKMVRFPSRNSFRFFFQGDLDADFLSYSLVVL